nr:MAG TPA: hypothetical protein [Caudoviricetes sp.]DAP72065.1 MAG TPA: hypothetical protein [Caudoviricetes sp.]
MRDNPFHSPAIIYLENNRQPYYKNCSTVTDTYKKRSTI